MNPSKEELTLRKRFVDLARTAHMRGIVTSTDFLPMGELATLHSLRAEELAASYHMYGGYELAERQMAIFVSDAFFGEPEYPIETIRIRAKAPKFAQTLTHRDYLGAMLHLGVDRGKLGDVIVLEKEAYAFCHAKMADFFVENLTQVRHTAVTVTKEALPEEISHPEPTEFSGTTSSLRADSIVALAVRQSRSSILELFRLQKIFVNGKSCTSNSQLLKEGDVLTVRGYGRFVLKEVTGRTKKDRLSVLMLKY